MRALLILYLNFTKKMKKIYKVNINKINSNIKKNSIKTFKLTLQKFNN